MHNPNFLLLSAFCSAKRWHTSGLNLQLFGAASAGDTSSGEGAGDAPAPNNVPQGTDGQAAAAPAASGEASLPAADSPSAEHAKQAEFERLIRGEYKDEFAKRTQSILDKRFRQAKEQQTQLQQAQRILNGLATQYGVAENDLPALEQALAAQGSPRPGQPAETKASPAADAAARQICADWLHQSSELKQTYPDFDLRTELQAPEFARMLQSGVSLRAAYQACHLDTILGQAMQYAAGKAVEAATLRLADRAARPAENGALPRAAAVFRPDVNKMSRAERERIERRAARGEQIVF
ncbi:MAG: hypothetical protein IJ347_01650 [Faecalibacterium sp.]|nr:hypothetical protein [Faecalibacterium sp.]